MVEELQFIYKKEFWYISALVNTEQISCTDKICDIETLIREKTQNLTNEDLKQISWNPEYVEKLKELGKNISLKCDWVPFIDYFPYHDENTDLKFDSLGYFQFEIEYYESQPEKKASIDPILIQQIPTIILEILTEFSSKIQNRYLFIDPESPIYVFVISSEIKPGGIQWSRHNIEKYKKVLGNWTEIYSGQWPDYSESLYDKRIQNNLSNRLSELHFIRRNSGFIFMVEENYRNFFESYMMKYVLIPTAQIRSMLFALMALNESLDILFIRIHHQNFTDLAAMEEKLRRLKYLRGMIQTQMSLIYNELDYNRRQHYTSVLTHLIQQFNLNRILDRVSNKFDVFYDSMQVHYQKKMEENQSRMERGMNLLNILFGIGILADLGQVAQIFVTAYIERDPFLLSFNISVFAVITSILIATIIYFLRIKSKTKTKQIQRTVDAVIVDENGNIVIIERKNPPFRGQLALPGGFINPHETPSAAVLRETREETSIDVEIIKEIGIYDKIGRDPRGDIISTAFLCVIKSDIKSMRGGDDAVTALLVPLEKLKSKILAFDHEEILIDAVKFILNKKLRGINPILDSEKLLKSAEYFLS